MNRRQKHARVALIAAAVLALMGLFARLELKPEPTEKGICTFCNGPYKAMVLGAYGVVP